MAEQYDLTIERAMIGAMLTDPEIVRKNSSLMPSDFFSPFCASVWATAQEMTAQGRQIDPITLAGEMKVEDPIGKRIVALGALLDECVVTTSAPEYARKIREYKQRRDVLKQVKQIEESIIDGKSLPEIHKNAQAIVRRSEPVSAGSSLLSVGEMLEHLVTYHSIQAEAEKTKSGAVIVPTPWPKMNRILKGGFRGSKRPIYFAAQEKVGKTQVLLKILLEAAASGIPAVGFSLELPHLQIIARLVGLRSGINSDRILQWVKLTPDEQSRAVAAMEWVYSLPLYFDGRVDWRITGHRAPIADTVDAMRGRIRRLEDVGVKPGIVGIDYCQKIQARFTRDERGRFVEVSEDIQAWSTESPYPVVGLLQCLSRKDDKANPPTAADIFGSSQFAKDCSMLIIADRPPCRANDAQRSRMSTPELESAQLIIDIEEVGNTGRIEIRHEAINGDWQPAWMPENPIYYEPEGMQYE